MEALATHEMRITSFGKIHSFVQFGLKHFEANPDVALVLHTLPALATKVSAAAIQSESDVSRDKPQPPLSAKGKERMPPSTANVPRLISVVEILKREYLKQIDSIHHENGKLTGLYQYSEIGSLPDPELEEETRPSALTAALLGKNHLQIKKTPYMKVILSRRPLDDVHVHGFTSQEPSIRKLPRSTTARVKRRLAKQKSSEKDPGDVDMPIEAPDP